MKQLIFVYNANNDYFNKSIDFIHKVVSPNTYECNLCKLTYGIFSERAKWKSFREASKIEMKFIYRNEFERAFGLKLDYPVILESQSMKIVLKKNEINRIQSVDDLIFAIKNI